MSGAQLHAQRATGRSARITPPPAPNEAAWTTMLASTPVAGGIGDASRVHIPLDDRVVAIGHADGRVVWSRELVTVGSPVVSTGIVYVRSSDSVVALDGASGEEQWRTHVGAVTTTASSDSPPPNSSLGASLVGRLILVSTATSLVALSADNGTVAWRHDLPAPLAHPPIGAGERVFVALTDSRVVALTVSSGASVWERRLEGALAAPTLAGSRLVVGSSTDDLFALDADNGRLAWRWRIGADTVGSVATKEGLYLASRDNLLRAFDPTSGGLRWKRDIPGRPTTPPRLAGAIIVVVSASTVHMFDIRTGDPIGTYVAPAEIEGPPVVVSEVSVGRAASADGPGDRRVDSETGPRAGVTSEAAVVTPENVVLVVATRDGQAVGLRVKAPAPPPASSPAPSALAPAETSAAPSSSTTP